MTRTASAPILAIVVLALVAAQAVAATNRIVNPDFETAGSRPTVIPGWMKISGTSARVENQGVDDSAAAILEGPAVIQSADLFVVTPGESLNFSAFVAEMRDDTDGRPNWRGDSVVAIEFVAANGGSMLQLEFHCDAYVDLLDNDALDQSDTCTRSDGFVNMTVPQPAINCAPTHAECMKYNRTIVVPSNAVRARVLLGGDLATDTIDPIVTGIGVSSPTSITKFDNVFVGN